MGFVSPLSVIRALAGLCALSLLACLPPSQAGSSSAHVEQGELYRPGKSPYDEYFVAVHDLQLEMAALPDDRRAARATLIQALGLLPTASAERVLNAFKERANDVRRAGGHFVINGTMATTEGNVPEGTSTLTQGVSSCLGSERQLAERMTQMPDRADAVAAREGALETSVDSDFAAPSRPQVTSELQASKRVLQQIDENARAQSKSSRQLIDDLTKAALGTGKRSTAPKPAGTDGAKAPAPADTSDFNP